MAARKTKTLSDDWKRSLQTTMLVKRLQDNGLGKIELTKSQVSSINILLKKVIPDLSSVTVAGDAENPLKVLHDLGPDLAKKLDRLSDA